MHPENPHNALEPPRFPVNQSRFITDEDVLLTYSKSGTLHVPLNCRRKILGDPEQSIDVILWFVQVSSLFHRQKNSCSVSQHRKKKIHGRIMMREKMLGESLRIPSSKTRKRMVSQTLLCLCRTTVQYFIWNYVLLTNAFLNNSWSKISTIATSLFSFFEGIHLLILGCLLTPSIRMVHSKGLGTIAKPVVLVVTLTFAYLQGNARGKFAVLKECQTRTQRPYAAPLMPSDGCTMPTLTICTNYTTHFIFDSAPIETPLILGFLIHFQTALPYDIFVLSLQSVILSRELWFLANWLTIYKVPPSKRCIKCSLKGHIIQVS